MTKVVYNPGNDMPVRTSIFGFEFDGGRNGQPTEIDATSPQGARALGKLRAMQPDKGEGEAGTDNFVPWFEVLPDGAIDPPADDELKAVHNGGGRFIIVRNGDKANPVKEGLDKSDAAAFNALSDEDKAAYVAD